MPATIAFDMDGVLIDSQAVILESLDHALMAHGQSPVPEHLRFEIVGPPLRAMLLKILGDDAPVDLLESCAAEYRVFNDTEGPRRTPVFDGVELALQQLDGLAELIVVTSKRELSAELVLDGTGLRRYFNEVFGSPNDGAVVEKSETLRRSMAKYDAVTVLIGDRHHDVKAARDCGIKSIGVNWGYATGDELVDANAEVIIDHPHELLNALTVLGALSESA